MHAHSTSITMMHTDPLLQPTFLAHLVSDCWFTMIGMALRIDPVRKGMEDGGKQDQPVTGKVEAECNGQGPVASQSDLFEHYYLVAKLIN